MSVPVKSHKSIHVCRECESYASHAQNARLDFTTEEEKEQVQLVFDNAMQCLTEADRQLEAIVHIAPLLKAGIGVHHSGLLPIVKELTELLFQEHLIKVAPLLSFSAAAWAFEKDVCEWPQDELSSSLSSQMCLLYIQRQRSP